MHEYSKSINALDCEVKSPFAYIFMNLDFLFLSQISLNLINGLNLRILILYSNRSSSSPSPVPEDVVDASADAAADSREAEGRRDAEAPAAADAAVDAGVDAAVNAEVDAEVDAAVDADACEDVVVDGGDDADATLAKAAVEAPVRPSRRRDDLMDVDSIRNDDSAHAVTDAVLRPQRVAPAVPPRRA